MLATKLTSNPRRVGLLLLFLLVLSCPALAAPPVDDTSVAASAEEPKPWVFNLSAYGYFFTDQTDYLQPTLAVDHGGLHLEARYNYEARQTASVWAGWNFEWGETVTFALTPMGGVVFGATNGVAIGAEWSLAWGPLQLSSENEVVIDLGDVQQSYVYAWSELSVRPWGWLHAGLALQRTRAHASPREVQWGPLLGFSFWKIEVTGYYFNPGQSDAQYWVAYLGLTL